MEVFIICRLAHRQETPGVSNNAGAPPVWMQNQRCEGEKKIKN